MDNSIKKLYLSMMYAHFSSKLEVPTLQTMVNQSLMDQHYPVYNRLNYDTNWLSKERELHFFNLLPLLDTVSQRFLFVKHQGTINSDVDLIRILRLKRNSITLYQIRLDQLVVQLDSGMVKNTYVLYSCKGMQNRTHLQMHTLPMK